MTKVRKSTPAAPLVHPTRSIDSLPTLKRWLTKSKVEREFKARQKLAEDIPLGYEVALTALIAAAPDHKASKRSKKGKS